MDPVNTTSSTDQSQQSDNSGNGKANPNPNQNPVFSHQVEHTDVICDNCEKSIFGFRYKCCTCKDYDLCSTCERSGAHAGHVMLRIAFPEMATDAIQNHIMTPKAARCGGSEFSIPMGFAGVDPEHRRKGHCKRERERHSAGNAGRSPESSEESHGPVMKGEKEINKWVKDLRKTAHLHKYKWSAHQYASSKAGSAGPSQSQPEMASGTGVGVGATGESETQTGQAAFDFSAAASQIQEFLNAFGVPIDVVELYDEWGNRGSPGPDAAAAPQDVANNNAQGNQPPAAAAANIIPASVLAEGMQKLNIGNTDVNVAGAENLQSGPSSSSNGIAVPAEPVSPTASMSSGIEGDAGWTLLEDDRIEIETPMQPSVDSGPVIVIFEGSQPEYAKHVPCTFDSTPITATNVGTTPALSTTVTGPVSNETNQPHSSKQIDRSHLQEVAEDISSMTTGSDTLNHNIVPGVRPQQARSTEVPQVQPELTAPMQMTLNQLLGMGFSNHDGWLARLVVSKNGNLEEILNSLFPVGDHTTTTT